MTTPDTGSAAEWPVPSTTSLPVQTITGFLGAGKTTLIQRLLNSRPAGARVAVVVNEYGALPFDGMVLRGDAGDASIYDLPGGCICCTQAAHLLETFELLARRTANGKAGFDRILIEASGAATAAGIVHQLFALRETAERVPLDLAPTVAVVDCRNIRQRLTWDIYVLKEQLRMADVVILNRSGELPADELAQVEMAVREYAPAAPLLPESALESAWTAVCRPRFPGMAPAQPAQPAAAPPEPVGHNHHDDEHEHKHGPVHAQTHSHAPQLHEGLSAFEVPLPVDCAAAPLAKLLETLAADPSMGLLLRAKVILPATGRFAQAVELAGGRSFVHPITQPEPAWLSRLVLIGKNLDRPGLESRLRAAAIAESPLG